MIFGSRIRQKISWAGLLALMAVTIFNLVGCAYHFGYGRRNLPGSYNQLAIPVFENKTTEVGVEVFFTNSIIEEFERSQVAKVLQADEAPVTMLGTISKIEYLHSAQTAANNANSLPRGAVLTTEYRVLLTAHIVLRRNSDQRVIWQGRFTREKVFPAPQIGPATINSANATYLHSARYQTIASLASEMMEEAHDRMTENF